MGRSLHNKIYLGRRSALLNVRRFRVAACISAVTGAALALLLLKGIQ